jgi:hypothetical protein
MRPGRRTERTSNPDRGVRRAMGVKPAARSPHHSTQSGIGARQIGSILFAAWRTHPTFEYPRLINFECTRGVHPGSGIYRGTAVLGWRSNASVSGTRSPAGLSKLCSAHLAIVLPITAPRTCNRFVITSLKTRVPSTPTSAPTSVPCTLQLVRRVTIYPLSSKEGGEPHAPLWSKNLCGRYGPASPSSAVHAVRYPGTRQAADPAYKVA